MARAIEIYVLTVLEARHLWSRCQQAASRESCLSGNLLTVPTYDLSSKHKEKRKGGKRRGGEGGERGETSLCYLRPQLKHRQTKKGCPRREAQKASEGEEQIKMLCAAGMLGGKPREVARADPAGESRPGRALGRAVKSLEGNP